MFGPTENSNVSQVGRSMNLRTQASVVAQKYHEQNRSLPKPSEEALDGRPKPISPSPTNTQSTAGQSSLPLQWIDEQELRQNKTGLRKTVRSYARRDTCLRKQRKNAASRPNSKPLRSIVEKSGPKVQVPAGGRVSNAYFQMSQPRTSRVEQFPQTETAPPGGRRVPQSATVHRNKSESSLTVTAGNSPSQNNLADNTADDQCKDSVPRHHIRAVPVCRSRSRRRNQVSLPDPPTHETPREADHDSNPQDNLDGQPSACIAQSSHILSLDAKNILLYSSWRNDPFNVDRMVNNPRVSLLLSHHQEAIGSAWRPHVNRAFLEWNLSSEVLLHGLLYLTASYLYALTNCITLRHDILHHKGQVLRLINKSLDDPLQRISDTTIGALAYLILFEEMYGSKEAAAFHRDGLCRLLDLRKNTPGPGLNYFIIKMLPITGVNYSSQEEVSTPVIDRTSQSMILRSEGEISSVKVTIPSNAMDQVFAWLKNSARLVSKLAPDAPNRKKASYLARTKIQAYLDHLDTNPSFENRDSTRSLLMASLIYLHTITATVAELERLSVTEFGLVIQLRKSLQDLIASPTGVDYSCPVLLWILLLGRLPARDSDAVWFHNAIVTVFTATKIESWFETKELLKELPWIQVDVEHMIRALCPFDEKY